MASPRARVTFRILLAILITVAFFYLFRPLYWKISATIQDIRQNKQTVSGGISQIVDDARKSVGWYHDESDAGRTTARRILRQIRSRKPDGRGGYSGTILCLNKAPLSRNAADAIIIKWPFSI
ncbi:uncharacterized protein LOC127799533 [Diospyros lotus]|uniref:uncharacterized protein LOC127799533 n=1 Tax=Diospyros lotus TaxID=55363 RepID=UPI002252C5F9|nr:uncharacterized protein LOC127799533 [Diospyros lotus]